MAPEQILGGDTDARADIHAVGVLLFRLLVESLPLASGDSADDLLEAKLAGQAVFVAAPSQVNPRLNPEMDAIIATASAYDPSNRYPTCREFLAGLMAYERKYLGSH